MDKGHKPQRIHFGHILKRCFFLTFKMLQTRMGKQQTGSSAPAAAEGSKGEGAGRTRAPGCGWKGQLQFLYTKQSSRFGAAPQGSGCPRCPGAWSSTLLQAMGIPG